MSTVYGVNYTKIKAQVPTIVAASEWGGKVRCQIDEYEAASLANASTISIAKLPKGARWLGISKLVFDDLGSAVTLACGISGATTKFKAATSVASAGSMDLDAIAGLGYEFTADTEVILTTAGEQTGTIRSEIYYSVE
jgi:hypothetical protein